MRDRSNAEVPGCIVGLLDECRICAERPTNLRKIIRAEITTALEVVLERDTCCYRLLSIHFMVIITLFQGEEPNHSTNDEDANSVEDENPV